MKIDRDIFRKKLTKYTTFAFQLLPPVDRPRILDIGCGTGVPTMRLAELCNGDIIGLDKDKNSLEKLNRKIRENNLTDRVRTVNCSLAELRFEEESFDIIWAEGSVYYLGFSESIKKWRKYLKDNGFLVVHDELCNYIKKMNNVESYNFILYGFFILSETVWWDEYYVYLETAMRNLMVNQLSDEIKKIKNELELFKKSPERFRTAFFIMKKK